jgi:beta-glucuronidase
MENEKNNYQENIHNEEYKLKYTKANITYKDMIYDSGREKESLNGYWNFCIDQYDSFLRAEWYKEERQDASGRDFPLDYDFDDWEKVFVPSCWNTDKPEYFYYEGSAIYTRTFKYINRGEKKVFLKVGAANYEAYIFLNKQIIGYHKGGSTPMYLDITNHVQKYNRVTVVVDSTRRREQVPANNTDWYNYGGLYRDVEIIRLPEVFIKNFCINLVNGSNFKNIKVRIELNSAICCKAALKIPELGINIDINIKDGKGYEKIESQPELWSPENPKLYGIEVSCGDDIIKENIGFREIEVRGTNIYLNGKEIFLKGISCHEESVENGKAIKEDEIIENIKLAKEMNCNFMRLAHYPHTEKTAKIADEMGIMLWEEIPVYWAIDFDNPVTLNDAQNQLKELINRDSNRASIIIWSVGNENADTNSRLNFMKTLAITTKEQDPTRLVSAACLVDHVENKIADRLTDYLDIIGINEYYGWYDPDFEKLPSCFNNSNITKPVIISEFGADACAGYRGTYDDLFTEDMQEDIYKKQIKTISNVEYIKGISPWILYDFRCPRRHNKIQRGYNLKGLFSCDKKQKKLAYYIIKQFYSNK